MCGLNECSRGAGIAQWRSENALFETGAETSTLALSLSTSFPQLAQAAAAAEEAASLLRLGRFLGGMSQDGD